MWAVCMIVLSAYAYGVENVSAKASESFEASKIKAGLNKTGVGEGYEIVIADECDMVEHTAAQMMQEFLAKASLSVGIATESQATAKNRIILGRESNLEAIKELEDKDEIDIRNVSAEEDGFQVKKIGKDIVVAGANPRGVLYGAFAFEDFVREGGKGKLDIRRVPRMHSRVSFFPTFLVGNHPIEYRENAEKTASYLARLGMNGFIDGGGGSWELAQFVSSDVFPFQKAPDAELQQRIATTSSTLRKYGIDYYIMIWEPTLAKVRAEIDKYPPEALGKVNRPWGGEENVADSTLCVSSPIVQEHYKNLMKKFVQTYPDVKGILFYNLDGSSWLCTPELCPRCKAVCTDSVGGKLNPWPLQASFTDLLARAAHEERSDFKFIHWISHFNGEIAEKLVRTSTEYDALAFGVRAGDHDVMIADTLTPDKTEFHMLQKVCTERNLPFLVTFSSSAHEVIPNGFSFPFNISASMKKLDEWGVKNIAGCGPIPYFNPINGLAEKAFKWDPEQNPEEFLTDLSTRQFGRKAGKLMYQAWEEIREGMDVWKDSDVHPFCGSYTPSSLGFSYFTMATAILPGNFDYYHVDNEYLSKYQAMGVHMAKAAVLAKQAVDKADSHQPIGIHYYDSERIPTMKEYAELNYGPIAIADVFCQLRSNMFRASQLVDAIQKEKDAGNGVSAQEKLYHELIIKDIAIRKEFIKLLTAFSEMRPCLTRTSLSEEGIKYEIDYMNTEIGKMEDYLKQQ